MRLLPWLAVALIADPVVAAARPSSPRTFYLAGCGGQVATVDTVTGRSRTVDLLPRLQIAPVHGAPGATFDGCLLNQAVYVAKSKLFYTVVPDTATTPGYGTTHYRVLGISVPGLRVGGVVKRLASEGEVPRIAAGPGGVIVAPDPATALDLAAFDRDRATGNQIIETSGSTALIRLFTGDDRLVLGVADTATRKVVRLRNVIPTTALNVHLAPGGGQVYVEAVDRAHDKAVKTGTAATYDARAGVKLRTLTDPRIARLAFVAISPNGKAIYAANEATALIDLGARFTADPVTSATPSASFFAP